MKRMENKHERAGTGPRSSARRWIVVALCILGAAPALATDPPGTMSTVAGTGTPAFSGDGGAATAAQLFFPSGVAVDASWNILIADTLNNCIRKVSSSDGTITTVAGKGGLLGNAGDGGLATAAVLFSPQGVAVDASGNILIADTGNHRIRKVSSSDGTITTVAGTYAGFSGDGGPATAAELDAPTGVAVDASGNILIADALNNCIRKVSSSDGTITTVAGTGAPGFSGDGGPATAAALDKPTRVAVDASWNILIADTGNHRVRRVSSSDGTITTVAGTGEDGFSGDGGPATAAALSSPRGLALDASGNILIADSHNHRIRKVTASSIAAPDAIAQECDSDLGATVLLVFDATPGPADLLRASDVTGNRALLDVANPVQQQYGIGPVLFPHGASTVLIELLQGTTVLASATVVVQIDDTTAPVLAGCEPRTIELQGPLTTLTAALLGVTATDNCDPAPAISFGPDALPLGVTSVTATARDATGNISACVFDVAVVDTTPPAFAVMPEDAQYECEDGGKVVGFDVLAEDLSGTVAIACEDDDGNPVDPSGTQFQVGTHTVTCTASDASGNTATWSFVVTVVDTVAPVIVCPDDITVGNEPGECFAYEAFSVTATDECDPDVPITCEAPWGSVASGDAFPCGTTAVTCTARDHSGNEVSGTFHVTVEDREAPTLHSSAPATLVTDCAGAPLAIAASDLGVTATDNCDVEPVVTCSPALLAPGTTEVTCTARDDDGNEATSVVSVTVLKGPLECRFLRPLDNNVDNVIQPRRTVAVRVRVTCDNVFDPDISATIDEIVQLDGGGTPVGNEVAEDAGASSDGGATMRLDADGECYVYNLSTAGWPTTSGTRFRVNVRVRKSGHADALCEVVLRNK